MKRLILFLLLLHSPVYAADVTVVIGPENILGGGAETDPIATPILANTTSDLNTLEATFITYTAISFTTQSSFVAYTAIAGSGGNFVNLTGGTMTGPLIVQDKITGGVGSTSSGLNSMVLGGNNNTASTSYSIVVGGQGNIATDIYSLVSGGRENSSTGQYATVSGGYFNDATALFSTVAGGFQNNVTGTSASIVGGEDNTVSASYSVILGGNDNIVQGDYSLLMGDNLRIGSTGDNSVLFGSYVNTTERDANPLSIPDTMKLANMDLIVDGNLTVVGTSTQKSHAGYLSYSSAVGVFEDYTTADIFYQWQVNINDSGSFGNVSSSISGASITILTDGGGLYSITRNHGIHGQAEVEYSFDIFKNGTTIASSHTSPGQGIEAVPFFTNLSSFGDATYNTNSTIDFLFYNDKDQIKIVESSTGNGVDEYCFEYEVHFNIHHIPHFLSLGNSQYNGGAGHFSDAETFSNTSSAWHALRLETGDIVNAGTQADYKNENLEFAFPNDGTQADYISNGLVKVRLRHNDSVVCSSGHEIWIDKMSLTDLLGARSDSSTIIVQLSAGDKITIQEKPSDANKLLHRHKTKLNVIRIGD